MRGKVFVDLYRAVRQGLRASVESYSIKKLEPLYGLERTSICGTPARASSNSRRGWSSVASGRATGRSWTGSPATTATTASPRGGSGTGSKSGARNSRRASVSRCHGVSSRRRRRARTSRTTWLRSAAAVELLSADVPTDPAEREPAQQARWLLAQLLGWHRREEKPAWWRCFHLLNDLTDEERLEEPEPLSGLTFAGSRQDGKSVISTYRFPAQDHDISVGRSVTDPATGKAPGTVYALDAATGVVEIRTGSAAAAHLDRSGPGRRGKGAAGQPPANRPVGRGAWPGRGRPLLGGTRPHPASASRGRPAARRATSRARTSP